MINFLPIFKPKVSFLPVQFIIKKFLIIILFINIINSFYNSNSKAETIDDYGIISLMYRFDENKYPSTNIRMGDFKEHIYTIKNEVLNL